MHTFDKAWAHAKRIALFENIAHLAQWDQETYMPKGSAAARAEQLELLASVAHKEKTQSAFVQNIATLSDDSTLKPWQKAAVREWREEVRKARALPNSFVKAFAKLTAQALVVWQEARKKNAFSLFAPHLEKIVAMSRKQADYLGYTDSPYDALLDLYEPQMCVREIAPLFKKLAASLQPLIVRITAKKAPDVRFLQKKISTAKQLAFGEELLKAMGYDFHCGRLDESTHPFSTSMHPTDNRITTRITPRSFFDSLSAVLHEGGHGLYEMGLNQEWFGTPLGEARSLGIHESQSRFWETFIGQSLPFWKHFFPLLKERFRLEGVSLPQFYRAINRVQPSCIRVEADEVTYCLHVILRFEIERKLIEGDLAVDEIPPYWNEKMQSLLGITPPTDQEGCLQDIHWAMGGFGYFPTYALGTLYAAQFFDTFAAEHPDWERQIEKGELLFIQQWQREKIHRWGKYYPTQTLVKRVTQKTLSTKPYIRYLERKYLNL